MQWNPQVLERLNAVVGEVEALCELVPEDAMITLGGGLKEATSDQQNPDSVALGALLGFITGIRYAQRYGGGEFFDFPDHRHEGETSESGEDHPHDSGGGPDGD